MNLLIFGIFLHHKKSSILIDISFMAFLGAPDRMDGFSLLFVNLNEILTSIELIRGEFQE
jgi:hypothetical protein